MLLYPLDLFREIPIFLRLVLPGKRPLLLVIADVLLAAVTAIIDDAEIAAVFDPGVLSVLDLDGQDPGGVLRVIVS